MFREILSAFDRFYNMKLTGLSLSLSTRTALEKNTIMEGLSKIQEAFPQLSESNYDEKKDLFKIDNGEHENEKQAMILVEKGRSFVFAWGIEFPFGTTYDLAKIFNGYQESVSLLSINIEFIDVRVYTMSQWEGHHYSLVWNTFFKASPIFSMFEPQFLLDDDIRLKAFLSKDKRVLVDIRSDVNDSEVLNNSFENDTLQAIVGIAKTRDFPPGVKLAQLMAEHIEFSRPFIIDRFIPGIVAPLDAELHAISSEDKNK